MRSCAAASADSSRVMRRPVAEPPACTMRRRECPPSRPSARRAVAIGVEAHAHAPPARAPGGATPRRARARRSVAPRRGRRRACPRAWAAGESSVGQRGGDAALGPVARGLGERRAGDERHARALARRPPARIEAGAAGADDGDVGPQRVGGGRVTARGYRNAIAAPLYSATRPRSSTTPAARIPSGPTGSARSRRELQRRDWLGWERREAPAARARAAAARAPAARTSTRCARLRSAGAFDLDTPTSPGSWEAALHAAGGACALAEALLGGRPRTVLRPARRPGHHAEADARDGLLPVLERRGRRAARAGAGGERVLVLDWDVHHGNGTNAIFHASPEVLFASIHQ